MLTIVKFNSCHDGETLQRAASKMEVSDSTCDNNSVEIDSNSDFEENDAANLDGNPKLADALGKVLRMTQKKTASKKSIVLSKAKLHGVNKHVKKETCGFEIEPNPDGEARTNKWEEEDVKPDIKEDKKSIKKNGLTKHELIKRGRVIPSVLDREKERHLSRIATRGVVQLFNAVKQQQTTLRKQLSEKKLTETKREKILKSVDRKAFLNALSGTVNISLSKDSGDDPVKTEIKDEEPDEEDNVEKPSWEVLRNDFMMDAKLKDWDKKKEDEEELSRDCFPCQCIHGTKEVEDNVAYIHEEGTNHSQVNMIIMRAAYHDLFHQ